MQDPGWFLRYDGYNVLEESALEARFAFSNGFLCMRAARSVSLGPRRRRGPMRTVEVAVPPFGRPATCASMSALLWPALAWSRRDSSRTLAPGGLWEPVRASRWQVPQGFG
jgi:hypothetical protein